VNRKDSWPATLDASQRAHHTPRIGGASRCYHRGVASLGTLAIQISFMAW
jgi:hypothetical protein